MMADGFEPTQDQRDAFKKRREELLLQESDVRGRANVVATTSSPDEVAKAATLADEFGVPQLAVEGDAQSYEYMNQFKKLDDMRATAPKLRSWIDDPQNYAVSKDDLDTLSLWEHIQKKPREAKNLLSEIGTGVSQSFVPAGQGTWHTMSGMLHGLVADISNVPETKASFQEGADVNFEAAQAFRDEAQAVSATSNNPTSQAIVAGAISVSRNAPWMIAGLLSRKPSLALAGMSGTVAVDSFGKAKSEGMGDFKALSYAGLQGGIEAVTEMIPLGKLFGDIAAGTGFFKTIGRQLMTEIPGEQLATLGQDAVDWAYMNPEKTVSEFLAERPSAAYGTFISTLTSTGIQTSSIYGASRAIETHYERQAEMLDNRQEAVLDAMSVGASKSKLLKRQPKKFRELVQSQLENGEFENIHLDADKVLDYLEQNNVDAFEVLKEAGIEEAEIEAALQTGDKIALPTAEYLTSSLFKDHNSGIKEHTSFSKDGFTAAEKREYRETARDAESKVISELQDHATLDMKLHDSREAVFNEVRKTMEGVGFEGRPAEMQSILHAAQLITTAEAIGMDPVEFMKKHGPKIVQEIEGKDSAAEVAFNQAVDQGYEGEDIGEAVEWTEAIAKGLDMSQEARMQRAKDMGFDTDAVLYHGTDADIKAFDSKKTMDGNFWFTDKKSAIESGDVGAAGSGKIVEVHVSAKNLAGWDEYDRYSVDELIRDGFDGVKLPDGDENTYIIFNPANIRSVNAAFDPDHADSANILRQSRASPAADFDNNPEYEEIKHSPVSTELKIDDELSVLIEGIGGNYGAVIKGADATDIRQSQDPKYAKASVDAVVDWASKNPSIVRFLGLVDTETRAELPQSIALDKAFSEAKSDAVDLVKERTSNNAGELDAPYFVVSTKNTPVEYYGEVYNYENSSDPLRQNKYRGAYQPRSRVIRLSESRDMSTFMHESAHWYFDTLINLSKEDNAHPFVQEQLDTILQWGNVKSVSDIYDASGAPTEVGREMHEKFSETFEAYLREGKAPSSDLRQALEAFRQWLTRIYKTIKGLPRANLTPEITAVLDRMLASEEQIKAENSVFETAAEQMAQEYLDKGIITEKQFEKAKRRIIQAREEAIQLLTKRFIDDFERNEQAWWDAEKTKITHQVQVDIDKLPEQRAISWLSNNEWKGSRPDLEPDFVAKEEKANAAEDIPFFQKAGMLDRLRDVLSGKRESIEHADGSAIKVSFEDGFLTVESEHGTVQGYENNDAIVITGSRVEPNQQGKGYGVDLYETLIQAAFEKGKVVLSDRSVTRQAGRAWYGLAHRGYNIWENYVPSDIDTGEGINVGLGGASPVGANPFAAIPSDSSMDYFDALSMRERAADRERFSRMRDLMGKGAHKIGEEERALFQSDEKNLFVTHNISADKLLSAMEIGGLAMPSMAVARVDKSGFSEYGEISLLPNPDILDRRDIKTFDADIYSPRVPTAYADVNEGALDDIVKIAADALPKEIDPRGYSYIRMDESTVVSDVSRNLSRENVVQLAYLAEQGKVPRVKKIKLSPQHKAAIKLEVNDPKVDELAVEYYEAIVGNRVEAGGRDLRDLYFDENGNLYYRDLTKFQDDVNAARRDPYDKRAFERELSDRTVGNKSKAGRERFDAWINDLTEQVIKGKKLYGGTTNTGRRRFKPFTLENIIKDMKKESLRGGEQGFSGGAARMRASTATRELRSKASVAKARNQIVSTEEFEALKEDSQTRTTELLEELKKYYKFSTDSFGYYDDASSAIADKDIQSAFDLEADDGRARQLINEHISYLSSLPTEYFEAKATDSMSISDFDTAVVPRNIDPKVKEKLERAGVKLKYYKSGDEQDRLRVIGSNKELLFQRNDPPAWGPVLPPPEIPPMKLDIQDVKDSYPDGSKLLNLLPRGVREATVSPEAIDATMSEIKHAQNILKEPAPRSLVKFLSTRRKVGIPPNTRWARGIKDENKELIGMMGQKSAAPGLINDKDGMTIDAAGLLLFEMGYFNERPTPAQVLDLIASELSGSPQYTPEDTGKVLQREAAQAFLDEMIDAGVDVKETNFRKQRNQVIGYLSKAAENVMTADEIAPHFGFSTGAELLEAMSKGRNKDKLIREEVDRRMREDFGDPFNDGSMDEARDAALQSAIRKRHAEIELETLERAIGRPASSKLSKQMAQERLRYMTVGQVLKYRSFRQAADKWMHASLKAMQNGDLENAHLYKQRQLTNHHLYIEGEKLAEQIEKDRKHIKQYESSTRQTVLAKAGDDYVDQMDALLDGYVFRKEPKKAIDGRLSFKAWFDAKQADLDPTGEMDRNKVTTNELIIEQEEAYSEQRYLDALAEDAQRKNYITLDADEFLSIREEADAIYELAKLKDRLIDARYRRKISLAVDDVVASIVSNQPKDKPEVLESFSPSETIKRSWKSYLSGHRTLQSLARQMDGGKDGGAVWKYIVRRINDGMARKGVMQKQADDDLAKLFSVYENKEKRSFWDRKIKVEGLDFPLSKQATLSVALNWGNEKNRERLMAGENWDMEQVQNILATLDKRDWDFVQSVWDYMETFYEDANRVHKSVHGVGMRKVDAVPVVTRFGDYRGGYYPIKFDPVRSSKTMQRQLEQDQKPTSGRLGTKTKSSFQKERAEGKVALPIRLSVLDVIIGHIDQVTTSIAMDEALLDVGRVVMSPRFEEAVRTKYGPEIYNEILNTLRETKFGQEIARSTVEKVFVHLRNGITISGLGLNVSTALLQPLGLGNSIVRVGSYWIAKGIARTGSGAVAQEGAARYIFERSEMMQNRRRTQSRELADLRKALSNSRTPRWITDSYMWMITATQFHFVDMPTWFGQYEKSLAAGFDDVEASAHADQAVVDAQGGGNIHELANIQRGSPLLKVFTNFMSYMVTTTNLAAQRVGNTNFKNPKEAIGLALDTWLLLTFPVVSKMVLDAVLKGAGPEGDDDEPEEWAGLYARQQMAFLMSSYIGFNQVSNAFSGFRYTGPTGTRPFGEMQKAIEQGMDGDIEGVARATNQVAGAVFHYPAGQVDRTYRGAKALFDGDTDNPAVLLFGPRLDEK